MEPASKSPIGSTLCRADGWPAIRPLHSVAFAVQSQRFSSLWLSCCSSIAVPRGRPRNGRHFSSLSLPRDVCLVVPALAPACRSGTTHSEPGDLSPSAAVTAHNPDGRRDGAVCRDRQHRCYAYPTQDRTILSRHLAKSFTSGKPFPAGSPSV